MLHLDSPLLDSDSTDGYKPCVRIKSTTVAEYTEGADSAEAIKPGMMIPFTCTVYEKVLINFDKTDIAEKSDEED